VDKNYALLLNSIEIQGADSAAIIWSIVGLATLGCCLALLSRLYNRHSRKTRKVSKPSPQRAGLKFRHRALALGFRLVETKTLKNLATKLMPRMPEHLLTTVDGRQVLRDDIARRIERRQREIAALSTIFERLEKMDEHSEERKAVRVPTNLHVHIIKATAPTNQTEPDAVPQVLGQLLNISEGGAAIRTTLEIDPLELVHFWLADAPVPLSQLKAGVVDITDGDEENPPTLHLYFIDPPLQQLRALICQLQRRQYDEYTEFVEKKDEEELSASAALAAS
jgi:hypothetical protein